MAAPEEAAAAAASGVGGGEYDLPIEEVDALLASFSGDPTTAAFAALPETEAGTSREGLVEMERFLMGDMDKEAVDGTAVGVDEFVDAILVGDGESNGVPDPAGGGTLGGASTGKDEEEVVGADGDDDPNSKKKMRQVKNRDSAMKSRERKKLYVKDLEMKSKYLEAECCRLSYALQCCAAENVALRHCLQKDRPGAPTALQESAVLMETPPLVSLLWLVCIVYLFLMPRVPNRNLVAPSSPKRDPVKLARMVTNGVKMIRMAENCVKMTGMTTNSDARGTLELIRHGRRCKGRRARMKFPWLPWHASVAS